MDNIVRASLIRIFLCFTFSHTSLFADAKCHPLLAELGILGDRGNDMVATVLVADSRLSRLLERPSILADELMKAESRLREMQDERRSLFFSPSVEKSTSKGFGFLANWIKRYKHISARLRVEERNIKELKDERSKLKSQSDYIQATHTFQVEKITQWLLKNYIAFNQFNEEVDQLMNVWIEIDDYMRSILPLERDSFDLISTYKSVLGLLLNDLKFYSFIMGSISFDEEFSVLKSELVEDKSSPEKSSSATTHWRQTQLAMGKAVAKIHHARNIFLNKVLEEIMASSK